MRETTLMKQIQIAFSRRGARLFRNNVGQAWTGKLIRPTQPTPILVNPGDVVIRSARPVTFGLAKGSADLIGWSPITIRQDHVGRCFAVFTSVETKNPNQYQITNQQAVWARAVEGVGGISGIVTSIQDAMELINEFEF